MHYLGRPSALTKLEITEGKDVLANVVRMLVAWERSLEER